MPGGGGPARRTIAPDMQQTADPPPEAPPETRVVTSAELLGGAREIAIQHGGETYRLRLTSKDRLILTK